jgi:hypothetical protein
VRAQVDRDLTTVGRFDSTDSIISINNTNQKPGASQMFSSCAANTHSSTYGCSLLTNDVAADTPLRFHLA